MEEKPVCSCSCSGEPTLLFACSGASDVGELTDRAARRLSRDKNARMFCTAAIGGKVEEYMTKTQSASNILLIDGCEHHCVKRVMEQAGFNDFEHVCLSNFGFIKGEAPATGENIERVALLCRMKLGSCC
jgi:uncharacterized metal-binding protein